MFSTTNRWAAALKAHRPRRALTPFEEVEGPQRAVLARRERAATSPPSASRATSTSSTRSSSISAPARGARAASSSPRGRRARASGLATLLADHGLKDVAQGRELRRGPSAAAAHDRARRARPRAGLRDAGARRHRRAGHPRRPPRAPAAQARRPSTCSPRRRACRSAISSSTPTTASAALPASRPSPCSALRTTASRSSTRAATSCSCPSRTSSCCRATARTKAGAQLDRLGGVAWQSRKARLKKRLREIASELIKIAALRQLKEAPAIAAARRRLRRVRRPLPLRGDRGPGRQHRSGARRSRLRAPDGSAGVRRRRLRQDGGRAARRLHRRHERLAGGGRGADDAARAPALQDLLASASRACRSASRRPRAWSAPRSWRA